MLGVVEIAALIVRVVRNSRSSREPRTFKSLPGIRKPTRELKSN